MKKVVLFLVAFVLWLALTWSTAWEHLLIGFIVSLGVALWFGDIFVPESRKSLQIARYFWFILYLPVFVYEMIKANFDVAYRVLHPKLPIRPGIVKVKTSLRSDIGLTALGNSITLTPGTITIDIQDGYLYIHWIDVKAKDVGGATKFIPARFEGFLRRIFG